MNKLRDECIFVGFFDVEFEFFFGVFGDGI